MDKEYITRLIYEYNPQLRGEPTEVPQFKRYLYPEVTKWIKRKQIIAVVGLRRVGKTTLMRQVIKELSNAVFFSFDEEDTQNKDVLVFVVDYALNNLNAKYIFLDEVHYVKGWSGILKRYYDTRGTKFVVSGSESLDIRKARESLAGRIVTFNLDMLTFEEYLRLKGLPIEIPVKELSFENIEKLYEGLLTRREILEKEFIDYVYRGAFPELVQETDEKVVRKYISELVVRKIIYRDIPSVFEVKRRDLLFEIFKYICNYSASLFEIKNLCNILNADYQTVSNYLFYLRESFLIKISENYSGSLAKRMRRNKKVYVSHPSLAFTTLLYTKDALVEKTLGPYVETLFAGDFFWRSKHKDEVDAVLKIGKKLIPIETKYKESITPSDTRALLKFMEKFDATHGVMITKDTFKREKIGKRKIFFLPAWLVLLLKSRGENFYIDLIR